MAFHHLIAILSSTEAGWWKASVGHGASRGSDGTTLWEKNLERILLEVLLRKKMFLRDGGFPEDKTGLYLFNTGS